VYRYLNIGSGKLPETERKGIPHYLIDAVDPDVHFTACDFVAEAEKCCKQIEVDETQPLFVGGTGMYIDALMKGISAIPSVPSSLRESIKDELQLKGAGALHDELHRYDPDSAVRIHPNDHQRLIRAIEVYRHTGKTLSSYFGDASGCESEKTLYIGLEVDRDVLNSNIDKRVDSMMDCGFLQEVISLRERGYGPELKSMQSIGYLQLNRYLNGEIELDHAVDQIKKDTRKYAKRQMTWFKKIKKSAGLLLKIKKKFSGS
jgi:tRNA dimethylallyltransferase